jgi:hypothetical protein
MCDKTEFDGLLKEVKRMLNSHIGHEKENSDGYVIEVSSDGFLYWACKRVRDIVINHVKYTFEGVEDLNKIPKMHDTLFDLKVVSRDQHDAIHRHKDTSRECTLVKRKFRLS